MRVRSFPSSILISWPATLTEHCRCFSRLLGCGPTLNKTRLFHSTSYKSFAVYLFVLFCITYAVENMWSNKWRQLSQILTFFFHDYSPTRPSPPRCWGFEIKLRHTTFDRNPLDECLARRRDLYLTTHSTHKRRASITPAGFEPAIPASERPLTHALDRAAIGIGEQWESTLKQAKISSLCSLSQ
jgi:hypothetical protein